MKVSVHPSMILWLSVLFYLDGGILAPFLLAAFLHEMGHYLALTRMGKPPLALALRFSGASMETPALSYRQELWAAAAGPAVSLALGLLLPLWPALAMYSVILGLFNLLPIPGLDGSRILRCLLLQRVQPDTARRISKYLAILTALALWGLALYLAMPLKMGLWPMLLAAMLLYRALSMEAS